MRWEADPTGKLLLATGTVKEGPIALHRPPDQLVTAATCFSVTAVDLKSVLKITWFAVWIDEISQSGASLSKRS